MRDRLRVTSLRRAEARLWTGPAAHLLGGTLDVLEALGKVGLARLRPGRGR
ncbi:MAG TPA: hypothetical protein VH061_07260 [Solirubrobacteraceae bacterium]|jgi:hypothetical protein|nr:hypothetical protein [Solirubrobacteraceae bacterium]